MAAMNAKQVDELAAGVIDVIKRTIDPLKMEIAALRHEVGELKARPKQTWAGTHSKNVRYAEASIVTRGGSLWIATRETAATPGESPDWTMILKRGAHDAR
jgi:hypothetical protein